MVKRSGGAVSQAAVAGTETVRYVMQEYLAPQAKGAREPNL